MMMNTEPSLAGRRRRTWLAHGAALAASPLLLQWRTARAATSVTDLAGRQVAIPAGVKRVVLGEGRLLYTLALLEDPADPLARVAGWQGDMARFDPQTWAQYQARYPHIARVPTIGAATEASVSPEKVLSLAPDLAVFSLSGHGPGRRNPLVEQLQAVGVPVVFIDFREHPLTNTLPSLRVLGRALHREAQAERFIAFYEAQMRRVTDTASAIAAAERPRTLLDARAGDVGGVLTAGRGSLGELVELAGGRNLGHGLIPGALGEASVEAVLAAQPEVYVATGYQAPDAKALGVRLGAQVGVAEARDSLRAVIQRRPEIASLPAVRQGRVHGAWHHFYNTPYHVVLAQALAKWLHPQRFGTLDPEATWRELHRQFLGVQPTGTYWVSA
jgi:iron complex transport system substrate-binding protein